MFTITEEKTQRLNETVRGFLSEQLGERARTVSSHLNNNILAIYAHGAMSPGELNMLRSGMENNTFLSYKAQQFEVVKSELQGKIKQILGQPIGQIDTLITKDGSRIINIWMS